MYELSCRVFSEVGRTHRSSRNRVGCAGAATTGLVNPSAGDVASWSKDVNHCKHSH
jgi:hypothetical protein